MGLLQNSNINSKKNKLLKKEEEVKKIVEWIISIGNKVKT